MRGADRVARALERAGARIVFTVSGNHVMPIFDAVLDTGIRLVHARHEAAAVHMADAFARLTGECGFALVTGGPGHANAVAALYTALAAEAPLVLLSGHAPLSERGRGAFQEMDQAALAAPVAKASWTAGPGLDREVAEAVRIARAGRPGPVHLSLPVDLLEGADEAEPTPAAAPPPRGLSALEAAAVVRAIEAAQRPLILAGPLLRQPCAGDLLARLGAALGVPAIAMESPRGLADPALGAFAQLLPRADLVVLLGKPLDFTLRFGAPPFVDPACGFVVLDPDPALLARAMREKGERVVLVASAEARAAAETLCERGAAVGKEAWRAEVAAALAHRPEAWDALRSAPGRVHPVAFGRAVAGALAKRADPVFVCDGGEIGQWAQSLVPARDRIVNGVAGSIGAAVPFAVGAAAAAPGRPVLAVSGDGAFGFHMAEFDTALRDGLPFVAVIGNDAAWNAEHQIQLRAYGPDRAHGCTLLPSRYDRVVEALGGHGAFVTAADELPDALEAAFASGRPACVNVLIEQVAAPTVRR
jgi:acetolactate synthase I/II/III large subunit